MKNKKNILYINYNRLYLLFARPTDTNLYGNVRFSFNTH